VDRAGSQVLTVDETSTAPGGMRPPIGIPAARCPGRARAATVATTEVRQDDNGAAVPFHERSAATVLDEHLGECQGLLAFSTGARQRVLGAHVRDGTGAACRRIRTRGPIASTCGRASTWIP
jgi:hypothetical protein